MLWKIMPCVPWKPRVHWKVHQMTQHSTRSLINCNTLSTLILQSRNMGFCITFHLLLCTRNLRFLSRFRTYLSCLMLIIYFTYFILLNFTNVTIFHNEKKCEINSAFCSFSHYFVHFCFSDQNILHTDCSQSMSSEQQNTYRYICSASSLTLRLLMSYIYIYIYIYNVEKIVS
jgi:hypothetical protein